MANSASYPAAQSQTARPILKVPATGTLLGAGSGHGAAADAAALGTASGVTADVKTAVPAASTTWGCSTATLDAKGQAGGPVTEPLTVGQTFIVSCEGQTAQLDASKIYLLPPKENPYGLRLLQLREMPPASAAGLNKISFIATTYVASEKGPLPITGYVLTDGKTAVAMAPLQLQSHTVITQDKNPDKKAYGPFGPLSISYPLWVWLLIAVVAAAFASAIGYIMLRRVERRKFMAELDREASVLSPYNQFNKELRTLGRMGLITETQPWTAERAKEMLVMLQSALRWYIAREFEIPAHKLPLVRSVEHLSKLRARRLGARFQADEKEIATAFRELQRALEHPSTVSYGEVQQLTELCRQAVERLNKWPFTRGSAMRSKAATPEVRP